MGSKDVRMQEGFILFSSKSTLAKAGDLREKLCMKMYGMAINKQYIYR